MANAIRSTPAIHLEWCEQNIVIQFMYTLNDILDEGSKFPNRMFISFPQFVYCSRDEVFFPKLSCLPRLMAAPCLGCIQRLLCITFMSSQSQLWRSCCIMKSHGPGLRRRCFKRGFGGSSKTTNLRIGLNTYFNWNAFDKNCKSNG